MSTEEQLDGSRRHFLLVATTVTGLAGVGLTAVPFLASWKPSARAQALGAPVEQDISKLEPGAVLKVNWRGQAIFVVRRTPEMLQSLDSPEIAAMLRDPNSEESEQPAYAKNDARALKPEYLVLVGVCTRRSAVSIRATPSSARTGRAVFIAPATARNSTCQAASSRTFPRRRISKCLHTGSSLTMSCRSASTRRSPDERHGAYERA